MAWVVDVRMWCGCEVITGSEGQEDPPGAFAELLGQLQGAGILGG